MGMTGFPGHGRLLPAYMKASLWPGPFSSFHSEVPDSLPYPWDLPLSPSLPCMSLPCMSRCMLSSKRLLMCHVSLALVGGQVAMTSFLLEEGANIKAHMNAEERFKGQERDYSMPEDLPLLCHAAAKGGVAMVRAIIEATDEGLDVRDGKVWCSPPPHSAGARQGGT